MIRRQFSVFEGVGPARERAIRAAGIADWEGFLSADGIPGMPAWLQGSVAGQILEWTAALERRDAAFFARIVPRSAHWALFEELGEGVRYLDIETTGLSPGRDEVTVVGVHDGSRFVALVKGRDLTGEAISDALAGCSLLVSYFGSVFDVPFLKASFPGLDFAVPHFDLCFAGRKAGLRGGLKSVERQIGIARDDGIAEVDGFEAVRLWRRHERGDASALATLVQYNRADTENLARIAPVVYGRLCGGD